MRSSTKRNSTSPWFYVPSLYFQQGIPVILVQQFSVILYKRLGISNDRIGLWTSLIAWPWILKMFWSPAVDLRSSKRTWVLAMQLGVILGMVAVAFSLTTEAFLPLSLIFFVLVALCSATHDIALDGYYLLALDREEQALFVGVRSTFFRLAMIFTSGGLVILAGLLERTGISVARSWELALGAGAGVYTVALIYAFRAMPRLSQDRAALNTKGEFTEAFRTFFSQKGIGAIVGFFILYRFGESMLTKVSGLFLLDSRGSGGLGMDTVQAGAVLGEVGVIALVAGGILGGMWVSKFGLRRSLWPLVLTMNLPNLLYVWAARVQPAAGVMSAITAVEQFSYGLGMAPYMVFAMEISRRSRFQTSHYAITAGLMALGAMIAGIASGYLQVQLGYFWLFVVICLSTVPGMILLTQIPLEEERSLNDLVSARVD